MDANIRHTLEALVGPDIRDKIERQVVDLHRGEVHEELLQRFQPLFWATHWKRVDEPLDAGDIATYEASFYAIHEVVHLYDPGEVHVEIAFHDPLVLMGQYLPDEAICL